MKITLSETALKNFVLKQLAEVAHEGDKTGEAGDSEKLFPKFQVYNSRNIFEIRLSVMYSTGSMNAQVESHVANYDNEALLLAGKIAPHFNHMWVRVNNPELVAKTPTPHTTTDSNGRIKGILETIMDDTVVSKDDG